MTQLKNRTIDNGVVRYNEQGLIDYLLKFGKFDPLLFEETEDTQQFNELQINPDRKLINQEPKISGEWFIPPKYLELDLDDFFLSKVSTPEEIERVNLELTMFKERNMQAILGCMIFLVDFMEENDIVWGVGRGSSVASFCLYLAGIHDINSLEHEIPITEFLR